MVSTAPAPFVVAVAAASRHGATAVVADRVATVLRQELGADWHVHRSAVEDLRDLTHADAVVLGSAIYRGRWMRAARRARAALSADPDRPLWLFSTGPVCDTDAERERLVSADEDLAIGSAREHAAFGGVIDPDHLSTLERLLLRRLQIAATERRDWADIVAWARGIADELRSWAVDPVHARHLAGPHVVRRDSSRPTPSRRTT